MNPLVFILPILLILLNLAIAGGFIYVVLHFVFKFW